MCGPMYRFNYFLIACYNIKLRNTARELCQSKYVDMLVQFLSQTLVGVFINNSVLWYKADFLRVDERPKCIKTDHFPRYLTKSGLGLRFDHEIPVNTY